VGAVKVLDYHGIEGRQVRLMEQLRPLGIATIRLLGVVDDTAWAVRLFLYWTHGMPAEGRKLVGDNLIAHVDARTGALLASFHPDETISSRNREEALRSAVGCMSPELRGGVAVFSHWTFRGTTYSRGATTPQAQFSMKVDWASPRPTGPGSWLWPDGYSRAACAHDFVAFWFLSSAPGSARLDRGHLDIRDGAR
jgi:hypothetical protein